MIPTLHTAQMTLGPLTPAHAEAFIAFCATDASRFLGGPADRMDAWEGAVLGAGMWVLRGYGPFWLTLRDTGHCVGRVGVTFPDHRTEPELAWMIYPAFQSRGLATEAALAARDWAYRHAGLGPLMSLINPENLASVRVAQKLGALPEGPDNSDDPTAGVIRWRHPAGAP